MNGSANYTCIPVELVQFSGMKYIGSGDQNLDPFSVRILLTRLCAFIASFFIPPHRESSVRKSKGTDPQLQHTSFGL